jgi:DNA-binding beta-propeller fold protein YncE
VKISKLAMAIAMTATVGIAGPVTATAAAPSVTLEVLGTYASGAFDESAAEIVAHDPRTQRLFVVNANDASVDVLDIMDPSNPVKIATIDATKIGAGANSVAVSRGIVAVAIEAETKTDNGKVAFYRASDLQLLNTVEVGALPDMLTFTANGQYVLVANEGEPNSYNEPDSVDPEGSVSIIDLRRGVHNATVRTADFKAYIGKEDELRGKGVRIFGPGANAAQDLEPEYITVSPNSRTAWVALQENNALAVVDIRRAKVTDILPLGYKDHSLPGNELDASNRDGSINIASWPVLGMYQPDTIASYKVRGRTYIVTANEGDARDYDGFSEEERMGGLDLDPAVFPDADELQENENLGRLNSTTTLGDADGDGLNEELYAYGARSFSIWDTKGNLVYDSGSDFERIVADRIPDYFNSNNDDNDSFDSRSDDKGPEPEALEIGRIFGRSYAFIGLERVGGIMVYDITDPHKVVFQDYVNSRDFSADAESPEAGDLGPESIVFIPADKSPIRRPLLAVGNEISGTTTLYAVKVGKAGRCKPHGLFWRYLPGSCAN